MFWNNLYRASPTGSGEESELRFRGHGFGSNGICLRVIAVMRIFRVGIDGCGIFLSCGQEREVDHGGSRIIAVGGTNEPSVCIFLLAGDGDILIRLSLQIIHRIPLYRHINDKLESIAEPLVVLGQVSRHLKRAIEGDIERESWLQRVVLHHE